MVQGLTTRGIVAWPAAKTVAPACSGTLNPKRGSLLAKHEDAARWTAGSWTATLLIDGGFQLLQRPLLHLREKRQRAVVPVVFQDWLITAPALSVVVTVMSETVPGFA